MEVWNTLRQERLIQKGRRIYVCRVKEGSKEAGLSQGGQLSCLNVKLWVLLFCEMAQRCLQEQDCLSYQSFYLEALWRHWPFFLWRKQVAPLAHLSFTVSCNLGRCHLQSLLCLDTIREGVYVNRLALGAISNGFSHEQVSPCFVLSSLWGPALVGLLANISTC